MAGTVTSRRRQTFDELERRSKSAARRVKPTNPARTAPQAAAVARRNALINQINRALEEDYLAADAIFGAHPDRALVSDADYQALRTTFVREWAVRELEEPLDPEQAAAVAATRGDVQVIARAGSGKTRTLVTRSLFLQRHCRVSPGELLLLAFNKKAAEEMKSRLAAKLDGDLPHVMTFHALAHAVVHPEQDLIFDDVSADQLGLRREVQEVIDEHIRSEEPGKRIQELMLAHFREDWERIVEGRFQLAMDEFLAHRRALLRESLNGDYVKSLGERVIANALFEHGIEYRYESSFRWNGVNYRPDFTIPLEGKGGVVIEYFGIRGDVDYDEMSERKRQFWAERPEWTFIEFSSVDLAQHGAAKFVETLLHKLQETGLSCQRRSEEEIWQRIRPRALDHFSQAMTNFIGRCRKRNLRPESLESIVEGHTSCSLAEALFLTVGVAIYRDYLQRLAASNKEDFDGLVWRAVQQVGDGDTRFVRTRGTEQGDLASLRFVLIDEFQDFSEMFYRLVEAIRARNLTAQFFCVGDDWQAINAFAGSELRFFSDFDGYFRETSRRYIRTNYRSTSSIVNAGNALMRSRGEEARANRREAGSVVLAKLDEFRPSAVEQGRHDRDVLTPAVLRVVAYALARYPAVVILSRTNGVPWYVNYDSATARTSDPLTRFLAHIQSFLPKEDRERVTVSTAHRYKGLERAAVLVLDATQGRYPLLHPDWVFLRVFGDNLDAIEEEERRLFYVAITRARESLTLLTEGRRESPVLTDMQSRTRLSAVSWRDLPPVASLDGERLEIRVSNAYEVRDQLIPLGYHWNDSQRCWYKAVLADGFSFDAVLGQPWARSGVVIDVCSEAGEVLHTTR